MLSHSSVHDVGETERTVAVPMHEFRQVMAEVRPTVLVVDFQGAEREPFRHGVLDGVRLILVELRPHIGGLPGLLVIRRRLRREGFGEADRSGGSFLFERTP